MTCVDILGSLCDAIAPRTAIALLLCACSFGLSVLAAYAKGKS